MTPMVARGPVNGLAVSGSMNIEDIQLLDPSFLVLQEAASAHELRLSYNQANNLLGTK